MTQICEAKTINISGNHMNETKRRKRVKKKYLNDMDRYILVNIRRECCEVFLISER